MIFNENFRNLLRKFHFKDHFSVYFVVLEKYSNLRWLTKNKDVSTMPSDVIKSFANLIGTSAGRISTH